MLTKWKIYYRYIYPKSLTALITELYIMIAGGTVEEIVQVFFFFFFFFFETINNSLFGHVKRLYSGANTEWA